MTPDEATVEVECKQCECITKFRSWKTEGGRVKFVKPVFLYCPVCLAPNLSPKKEKVK